MRLKGKIALVTGARKGIGRAIARVFAREGAHLIITSRHISPDDAVFAEIRSQKRRVLAVSADVTCSSDCHKMVNEGLNHFGRIDILVNNAGVYPAAPIMEITEMQWDQVFNVNLKGTLLVTQAVAKLAMIPRKYGRIVNISSCDGKCPAPGIAHYAAAKAGVISLTKSMALELGAHNISANAVAPGWVETEAVLRSERWRRVVGKIPVGRLAYPEEIAHAVTFLSEDASEYITGATLDVNGGLFMS